MIGKLAGTIPVGQPCLQLARGARRRVELRGVMLLQYKGVELRPPGEAAGQIARGVKKEMYAD